jgi:type I restriction enzyme R subunit
VTQFDFLGQEWPAVHEAATRAEAAVNTDPRTACFYARRALELAVAWVFKHDAALRFPYHDHLSALIHEPTFKSAVGDAVFNKARIIVTLGNRAVHSPRAIPSEDAFVAVRELFHVSYWLARTYSRAEAPRVDFTFNVEALPKKSLVPKHTGEELQKLEAALREKDEKLGSFLAEKGVLDQELNRLRVEVAKAKKEAVARPDAHDYSEAQTRDYFIDLLLKEAGWSLDQPRDREYEVHGMPNQKETGYVDYILWGDDGKPLGVVEAKRTKRDPRVGRQQAELYADCLERQFGRRPIIFYSNGFDHWMWDSHFYPPRRVQGFYKKAELELLVQRRESRKRLAEQPLNEIIVERHYQHRAIRRVAEVLERDHDRKALLVMATGAGKTRTVIALSDLLMRSNWAKRVLFLADRVALVNQAVNAFKTHLRDSSPVNLVTDSEAEGRVFVSTYPTMMGLIDETREGQRRFGVGHFDLIIIDEAHRSVFQKYRAIFDYFDSFLVGLTATPKDEVDRNTYSLFDLEDDVPTDAYGLEEAVRDGFLVPSKAVSVPLKFQRDGIKYKDLSEEEKDQWDALEWDEQTGVPDRVEAQAVNTWLFNKDTVDKVLAHFMTRGLKVAGGDRLGKTILFAKNQQHAEFIAERFDANYPHLKGEFARVITFKTEYAQNLIDSFSSKEKAPHIAISVDMLDTGIDVPEVVNLVFFKLVRSKTKFWQMVGRGTRLSKDLFGPGDDKKYFFIFDYCQNLEYFSQNPDATDGSTAESLGKRLFVKRLGLIAELDQRDQPLLKPTPGSGKESFGSPATEAEVRDATAQLLNREVAAMNLDNFVVRPRRRLVEKYAKSESWAKLSPDSFSELSHEVAGLPSELPVEDEEAKRFDLLVLNLQLSLLRPQHSFERFRDQVKEIASLLEEKDAIPAVRAQMEVIQDVQTDSWWQDATIPMLEGMRRRLRDLVKLIEKSSRKVIYTDFEDMIGSETGVELPGFDGGGHFEKFRSKARAFLRTHQDHIAIHKLRMGRPLTVGDVTELERVLADSGTGTAADIEQAKKESNGLGLFVRRLVGLDREAAKEAFAEFLKGKTLNSSQIHFVNMIIDHLTENGLMDVGMLYESPFTDVTPRGPDGLFDSIQVDQLLHILSKVRERAIPA